MRRRLLIYGRWVCIISLLFLEIGAYADQFKQGKSLDNRPLIAKYGGPFVLKPKIAGWGARMSVGKNFIGDKFATIGGTNFTNIDSQDHLVIVGFKDHDVIIGTGIMKRGDGTSVDLRLLDVNTTPDAVALLKSNNPATRAKGAWALGEIGNNGSIPILIEALKDNEWVVRRYALLSLSRLTNSEKAVSTALESLSDKDGLVVQLAIKILLNKGDGDARVVPALLGRIGDQSWRVAEASITALGEIGDKAALDPLRNALKKKPILTEKALKEAIEKIQTHQ